MRYAPANSHPRANRMDELAQYIEPLASWSDLVLLEAQRGTLREIAIHVRQMRVVYGDWGFAGKSARGLGISALFRARAAQARRWLRRCWPTNWRSTCTAST